MSFNNLFNIQEGFYSPDNMALGAEAQGIDGIKLPNLEEPVSDSTDLSLDSSIDIEFKEPDEGECKNNKEYDFFQRIKNKDILSIHFNKYQQIEMLCRFVKACDKYRESGGWGSWWFDYSAPCFVPPFIKKKPEEMAHTSCDGQKKKDFYKDNPNCKSGKHYWYWMKNYTNYDWCYHYFDVIFGENPRSWNWWGKDGWVGAVRRHAEYHQIVRFKHGEIAFKWLIKRCPILKTLVYKDDVGKRFWKIQIGSQLADYTPLFNKLKTGGYIDCRRLNEYNSDETIGEFFRASYFFTPTLQQRIESEDDGYIQGNHRIKPLYNQNGTPISGESWVQNKPALNSWNYIDMSKVPDTRARTSTALHMNLPSTDRVDRETGWGYCMCDIFDRLIRNDPENCKFISEESLETGLRPDESESPTGETVNACEEVRPGTCSEYIYKNSYSWCNTTQSNSIKQKYNTYIQGCAKACSINEAVDANPSDFSNDYFYTIRTIDGNNDWTGEPGITSSFKPEDFRKAKLINTFAQANYDCVIDKYHATTNNANQVTMLEECNDADNYHCIQDNDGNYISSTPIYPDESTSTSSSGTSRRDEGTSRRGAGTSRRDAGTSRRGAGTSRRDAGTSRRDAGRYPLNLCEAFTNREKIIREGFAEGGCLESLSEPYNFIDDGSSNAIELQNNVRKRVCDCRRNVRTNFFVSNMIEYIWLNYSKDIIFSETFDLDTCSDYFSGPENIFNVCYNIIRPVIVKDYPSSSDRISDNTELTLYDYRVIGNSKRIALQAKLSLIEEFGGSEESVENVSSMSYFYTKINTLKKYIYTYIYILKWGVGNEEINNKLNKLDEMIEKIKNKKDTDFTSSDYLTIINYLNHIKKENKSIHYRAQIQNISTINLSNYYKFVLWSVGFIALSVIIYKKIKK